MARHAGRLVQLSVEAIVLDKPAKATHNPLYHAMHLSYGLDWFGQ